MPFIEFTPPHEQKSQQAQQPQPPAPVDQAPVQPPAPKQDNATEEIAILSNNKVTEFKKYLRNKGLYNGNINDPNPEDEFIKAIKLLEEYITKQLKVINPNAGSAVGLIWAGDHINPKQTPEGVEKALELILMHQKRKKEGQSNIETLNVEETMSDPPLATKVVPTADDHGLEVGDPLESQQTGLFEQKVPTKMDDRVLALGKMINLINKK